MEKQKEDSVNTIQELKRTYICRCGCEVTLEGETYKHNVKMILEIKR